MKFRFLLFISLIVAITSNAQYTKYVNPMIGTGGHGHTFPGATTPFGLVQLSPDTRIDGSWDGCSGYHDSDSVIYGFSHTHLSGTGCSDYGDIAFMPSYAPENILKENIRIRPKNITAVFNHKNEKAKAGYYEVSFNDIKVELTATTHSGLQRYTFNKTGIACIQLNLSHRDQLLESKIEKVSETKYQGLRRSKAWAQDQLVYYAFDISKTPLKTDQYTDALFLYFNVNKGEQILVKTGISSVDEKGATLNLTTEIPNWNFDATYANAVSAWDKELKRIEVTDSNENNKIKFYTALYHCMIHPNEMSDVDGKYRGRDQQVHQADGKYYTLYSLWDTHRALHPLLNLIDKERSKDFMKSFLAQFEQSGRLPMWELWNNETNCMIGFHSVSVILDAFINNVIDKDFLLKLYPAVKAEAMSNRFGLDKFRAKGYLDVMDEHESVSKTLEYAYDMWCVGRIADELGYIKDAKYFGNFAYAWQNVYDYKSGYMRPRKNGDWLKPFNPYEVNNHYTEANGWQYSFYVPHRSERPTNILDLFEANPSTVGREQSDITGLVGQYAHGNEPSHNYAYLLPHKEKQKYLQQIMETLYGTGNDGLCGNDDCGQMSAWFVFSAMGFYPTCPGKEGYEIGYPLFQQVQLNLPNSNPFIIKKSSNEKTLSAYTRGTIKNDFPFDPINVEVFILSNLIDLEFKSGERNLNSINGENPFKIKKLTSPVISTEKEVFRDKALVELFLPDRKSDTSVKIFYNLDSLNKFNSKLYTAPFYIDRSTKVYAFATTIHKYPHSTINSLIFKPIDTSSVTEATLYKMPNNWTVKLNSTYNRQYTADGPEGIIDGLYGETEWRKGRWQGYQSQDFEAVIDLQKVQKIKSISSNFLQDSRSWILMPKSVEFYTSLDGMNYNLLEVQPCYVQADDDNVQTKKFNVNATKLKAKYIMIKAKNYGKLPEGHQGFGGDAFIFVDEVEVK